MRLESLLFLSLLLLPIFTDALGPTAALVGDWKPIKDIKDSYVQEMGEFAVTKYNKESKSVLAFQSVVGGQKQVVSGTNYRLVVAVKDGLTDENYEAVVWDKPWLHFRNLTSFKLLRT